MNPKKNDQEIFDLLIMLLEGDLTDSQAEKLVSWSKTDPDAVKKYADFMSYYSLISSELASGAHDKACSFDSQFDRALTDWVVKRPETTSDSNTSLRGVDLGNFNVDEDPEESENCGLSQAMLEMEQTSPAVEIPKEEPKRELIQKVESDFKLFPGRPSKRKLCFTAAMAVSIMVFFGYVFFAPQGDYRPVVAKLSDSINAQWDDSFAQPDEFGDMVQSKYRLKKGFISILFNDGAKVTVEAPAELSLDSPSAMELFSGRIYSIVPDRAKGFAVAAGSSKIVDLGTEFGVEVDSSGNTQLHVTKGKTVLFAGLQAGKKEEIKVDAGSAKKVYNDGFVKDINLAGSKFTTRINSKTGLVLKGRAREVFYEPFDYAEGPLQDVSEWTKVEGGDFNVQAAGLSYGNLAVSGADIGKASTSDGAGYTLNSVTAEIASAGLLEDGKTLWFSAVVQPVDVYNSTFFVRLGTDYVNSAYKIEIPKGHSLGFNFMKGSELQGRHHSGAGFSPYNFFTRPVPADVPIMIVIEMIWNADSGLADTINYYLPDSDLNMGSPIGTIDTVPFDQAAFDTFSVSGKGQSPQLDEIRFGASYEDVVGGL